MADAGLFVGFGHPVRGREQRALAVFQEATQYYASLQEKGEIEGFEAVLLDPHGGDLGGFFLLRGEKERLAAVRTSDDFRRMTVRAQLVVESLGVVGAALGAGLEQQMALFQAQVAELT